MNELNNNQKKFLRKIAHDIRPMVTIGQKGLSLSVLAELDSTLKHHELIKVKIYSDTKDEKQQIINKILESSESELIQAIGGILTIYKKSNDNPKIILPK